IDAVLAEERFQAECPRFVGNDRHEMLAKVFEPKQAAQHPREAHRRRDGAVARAFEKFLELLERRRRQGLDLYAPFRERSAQGLASLDEIGGLRTAVRRAEERRRGQLL